MTLLDRLAQQLPTAKRTTLRAMIAAGRVRVNGVAATRANQPVGESDWVEVSNPQPAATQRVSIAPLTIVFEDDDVLVVDKPGGLLTSTVPNEKRPTALAVVRNYVAATSQKSRVGLIHRLDRDASGLLVFSKSHAAYESLKTQFFKHTVDRVYHAIVHGTPNPRSGRIDSNLIERADGSVRTTDEHAKGQRAITDYEVVESKKGRSLVSVRLHTGRKHQIRVHLSERGCPIVGDTAYGGKKQPGPLQLAAVELAFDHPRTKKRVAFKIDRLSSV
jgi:23S rRNA pseudouridine1911/1915/1917 synthase